MSASKTKAATQKFEVPPGMILIIPHCRAVGGKRTSTKPISQDVDGKSLRTKRETTQEIDNTEERNQAEALARVVKGVMLKGAQYLEIGYLTTRKVLDANAQELSGAMSAVSAFNARAKTCQVEARHSELPVTVALSQETMQGLANDIWLRFSEGRDAITSLSTRELRTWRATNANLGDLVVGAGAYYGNVCTELIGEAFRMWQNFDATNKTPDTAKSEYLKTMNLEPFNSLKDMLGATVP